MFYSPPQSQEICSNIFLTFQNKFPIHKFIFSDKQRNKLASVTFSAGECVYQGMKGLDRFLTFFIFKVIKAIPSDQAELRKKILDHFSDLEEKGELIKHLQMIMRSLIRFCELDYVSPLILTFDSILKITVSDTEYDLVLLREKIAECDEHYFIDLCENKGDFKDILQTSYFLTKGILDLAIAHGCQKIQGYIYQNCADILMVPKRIEEQEYSHRIV